jgi:lipopolysaccharide/colanic/teichoic acid biosynthesis glycosyltransferase
MIARNNVSVKRGSSVPLPPRTRVFVAQLFLKRSLDFAGAGVLIIVLMPLLVLISMLVLIDDGLPIIYRRRVVGQNGEFAALKFRTMRRDAEALLDRDPALKARFERNFKLKNDPRLTRLGSYMRRFSVDELPQLFNVLKGQMSLVGPRMITAAETSKYGPRKKLLLSVKPGLTGYWQVHGRQDVSYEERVNMDMTYIENWSLLMDVKILLLTPFKVFKREGAY